MVDRREFLKAAAALGIAGGFMGSGQRATGASTSRKMTIDLRPGSIGVRNASQTEVIELGYRNGFESVEPQAVFLGKLSDNELAKLQADMKSKGLVFGAAGLPVEFRKDDALFQQGMKGLTEQAAALQRAGVTRMGTYIMPNHDQLTYRQNFKQHADRLREAAKVLKDHGLKLGLEYVGPKTSWTKLRFPFIHTMVEMKELIAEIGTGNVGLILDSWHWYHARETKKDLLTLTNTDIVAVDLNDAPAGIDIDQMDDLSRELPAATGVIDVKPFLLALVELGYDGPVRAEPFSAALNKMPPDQAVATTAAAMKKAFALIE